MSSQQFYSIADAAARLGISVSMLYKLRRQKRLQIAHIGLRAIVSDQELGRFQAEILAAPPHKRKPIRKPKRAAA
jgi:hypothetical protein